MFKKILCIVLPVLVYFAVPQDIHPKMPLFFALTIGAVCIWATEIIPPIPTAAALTFLYVLCGIAKPQVVFGPWSSFLPWLCLAALVIGEALEESGLTKRLAMHIMLAVGATLNRAIIGLMITGVIMAFLLPDIMCRVIIFVAIARGLGQALDVDPKSRLSSALIIAGFCAATSPGYGFLTGTEMSLISSEAVKAKLGAPFGWGEYALANLPFIMLYCCVSVVMVLFFIRGKERLANEEQLKPYLQQRLAEMGPITPLEIKVFLVLAIGIAAILTQHWHGLPGTFLYALIGVCCYIPFFKISRPEGFRHLNIGFIIFVVACLSIGTTATAVGAPKWVADELTPVLEGLSPSMTVFASYLTSVSLNFILTPLAAVSTFTAPILEIADVLQMNPRPLIYAFLYGLDQYIFPYEYALLLYCFTTEAVTAKHLIAGLAMRIVVTGIGLLVIQIPYWHFIGLL